MTETAHLELSVGSKGVSEATRDLSVLERAGGAVENRMVNVKGAIAGAFAGTAVVGAITIGIKAVVNATIESERAMAQLEQRLKSTGNQVNMTTTQLSDMAMKLQGVTIFDDEAIVGAESLLLTFTRIGNEVFPKALESILNVSTAMGTDLNSAALQVGKALNDPVKGIAALSRAGIQFTVDQKKLIKSLVETGDVAGAQQVILGELETQMGGAARAARDTLGGALAGLKNDFMNLLEGDSGSDGIRGTRDAIESLAAKMRDPETRAAFANLAEGVFDVTAAFAGGITKMAEWKNAYTKFLADRGLIEADENSTPEQLQVRRDKLTGMRDTIHSGKGVWGNDTVAKINQQVSKIDSLQGKEQPGAQYLPESLGGKPAWSAIGHKGVMAPVGPKWNNAQTGELAGEDDGPSKKAARSAERASEIASRQRADDFERLRDSLMTEEEAIQASYLERESIITQSAERGSAIETDLRQRSKSERDTDLSELKSRKTAELRAIEESLMSEEVSIQESYLRREAIVVASMEAGAPREALIARLQTERGIELAELAVTNQAKHDQALAFMATEEEALLAYHLREIENLKLDEQTKIISHEEFLAAKLRLEEDFAKDSAAIAREKDMVALASAEAMFGSMGDMFATLGGKQSKAAKAAFAVSKALAIAQSVMNLQTAMSNAMTVPYPGNFAAMAMVAAEGASIISNLSSMAYGGAHDQGGRIPAGKVGIVGEKGMEFVEGPANVTSRAQTKRMLDKASDVGGGGSSPINNVSIVVQIDGSGNVTGQKTESRSAGAGDVEQAKQLGGMIDLRVRDVLIREQRQGGLLSKEG